MVEGKKIVVTSKDPRMIKDLEAFKVGSNVEVGIKKYIGHSTDRVSKVTLFEFIVGKDTVDFLDIVKQLRLFTSCDFEILGDSKAKVMYLVDEGGSYYYLVCYVPKGGWSTCKGDCRVVALRFGKDIPEYVRVALEARFAVITWTDLDIPLSFSTLLDYVQYKGVKPRFMKFMASAYFGSTVIDMDQGFIQEHLPTRVQDVNDGYCMKLHFALDGNLTVDSKRVLYNLLPVLGYKK